MTPFRNNEQAFKTVYDLYADMLYRIALAYMKNKEDAEDIVQEVFTKYFCGLHLPIPKEQEKAWLIRVTMNQCHDALRKRSYRMHSSLDEVAEVEAEAPLKSGEIFELIEHLTDKYKDVIVLYYLEGYSVQETAKLLSISVSAVKMRLKRGRELLKEALEKE